MTPSSNGRFFFLRHACCRLSYVWAGEYPIEGSKRLLVHLIDKAISQLESEGDLSAGGSSSSSVGSLYGGGGGEQLVGIFDLRGFSVTRNADFAFAAFMVSGAAWLPLVASSRPLPILPCTCIVMSFSMPPPMSPSLQLECEMYARMHADRGFL